MRNLFAVTLAFSLASAPAFAQDIGRAQERSDRKVVLMQAASLVAASSNLIRNHALQQPLVAEAGFESAEKPSEALTEGLFLLDMAQSLLTEYQVQEAKNSD